MINLWSPEARKVEVMGAAALLGGFLALLVWYMMNNQAPEPYSPIAETEEAVEPPPPPGRILENAAYFDISADYPGRTPLYDTVGPEADTEALALMEDFVRETLTEFKEQGKFDVLTPEEAALIGITETRKESVTITYEVREGARTVSYVFMLAIDTLGAHPNFFYRTFTFDLETGSELGISELFTNNSDYLTRLSSIAFFDLSKELGEESDVEYIREGVEPNALNFANFTIEGDRLVLLFPPYQVAPYAAGPQDVRIPLSQLKDILKSEYVP